MSEWTIDRTDSQCPDEKASYPKWFYNSIVAYVMRNSIKLQEQGQLKAYLTCTWAEQKNWLTESIIQDVLLTVSTSKQYPQLPNDADWYNYRMTQVRKDNTQFLHNMSLYLEDPFLWDFNEIEKNEEQKSAIELSGGVESLHQYAKSYSITSAIKMLEASLTNVYKTRTYNETKNKTLKIEGKK